MRVVLRLSIAAILAIASLWLGYVVVGAIIHGFVLFELYECGPHGATLNPFELNCPTQLGRSLEALTRPAEILAGYYRGFAVYLPAGIVVLCVLLLVTMRGRRQTPRD